jgi:hypothetical protein
MGFFSCVLEYELEYGFNAVAEVFLFKGEDFMVLAEYCIAF